MIDRKKLNKIVMLTFGLLVDEIDDRQNKIYCHGVGKAPKSKTFILTPRLKKLCEWREK